MPSFPGGVGLTIGIPLVGRPIVAEWAFCVANLHPPMNFDVRWSIVKGRPVDEARNMICQTAINEGAKYLFFLGDDVTCPPETIRLMIFHMEHNPDVAVIGGIYCHKSFPTMPMVFRGNGQGPYWDWRVGELFEVSGLGMDCTMIRVEALKEIPGQWFKTVDSIDPMLEGINKAEMWTEDLYFCHKVSQVKEKDINGKETDKQKYRIMADGSLICTHWDWKTGQGFSLPPNCKPLMRAGVEKGDKKIVDLGSGPLSESYETPEGKVLRVDIRDDAKPDYRCDIRQLPFGTGEFDIVFSSHTLEHFALAEVPSVIDEWIRILKPDGEMRLLLPNIEWAAQHIVNKEIDKDVMNVLYGAQNYNENFHKVGFTKEIVETMLKERGFVHFVWDFHNYHMFVRAWRVVPENAPGVGEVNPVIRLKKDESEPSITIIEKPVDVTPVPVEESMVGVSVVPDEPVNRGVAEGVAWPEESLIICPYCNVENSSMNLNLCKNCGAPLVMLAPVGGKHA